MVTANVKFYLQMNNTNFLLKKIKEKRNKDIIWINNKYYKGNELLDRIEICRKIIKNYKIKKSDLIAFESNFSFESIAFFIASLLECLIVIPVPLKQRTLLKLVPCDYFANTKLLKIIKNKKSTLPNKILSNFKKKKKPGLIVFSSGSSGKQKAILHDFSLLLNKFKVERPGFKTLLMLTFDHLGGINTLMASLIYKNGLSICIKKRDPITVCKIIEKTKSELLPTTPTFLNILLLSKRHEVNNLKSLKLISFGAEFMPGELLKRLKKQFPKVIFKQTYGLSEFGVMRTKSKDEKSLAIKIGGEDYKIRIKNNVLFVKSKTNMVGYLNAPQPFDKNGWINTQDRVINEGNGYLRILGRKSEIINVGGEKVYPQEIENTLLKCDGVADSRVYKKRHQILGEYIIAEIVFKKTLRKKNNNISYLRRFCEKNLPKYKIPSKFIVKNINDIVSKRLKKIRLAN